MTIYPSFEKITPEPMPLLLLENELFFDDMLTTDGIDFSYALTKLLTSSDIKYHVAINVSNITIK